MSDITQPSTLVTQIVVTPLVVATEFRITEVHESITNRVVRADIELGPFVLDTGPGGQTRTRATGRRSLIVWKDDAYDAVRDTWNNPTLIAKVTELLQAA